MTYFLPIPSTVPLERKLGGSPGYPSHAHLQMSTFFRVTRCRRWGPRARRPRDPIAAASITSSHAGRCDRGRRHRFPRSGNRDYGRRHRFPRVGRCDHGRRHRLSRTRRTRSRPPPLLPPLRRTRSRWPPPLPPLRRKRSRSPPSHLPSARSPRRPPPTVPLLPHLAPASTRCVSSLTPEPFAKPGVHRSGPAGVPCRSQTFPSRCAPSAGQGSKPTTPRRGDDLYEYCRSEAW